MASFDTTMFANENQKFKRFDKHLTDLDYAVITHALRDYDSFIQQLDEVVVLQELIIAQDAEIRRLEREKQDYEFKLIQVMHELEHYKNDQHTSTAQVHEQAAMVGKLLHALKTTAGQAMQSAMTTQLNDVGDGQAKVRAAPEDGDYDDFNTDKIYHEFRIPHNGFQEREAIIINGRTERMEADGNEFPPKTPQQRENEGIYKELFDKDKSDKQKQQEDQMQSLIEKLNARVTSVVQERDGLTGMIIKRIAALQANFSGIQRDQSKVLEQKETDLLQQLHQLIDCTKNKTIAEQKCLELEHEMGKVAAKNQARAQKARDGARNITNNAKIQLKIHEQNQRQEMQAFTRQMNDKYKQELDEIKNEINMRDKEIEKLERQVSLQEKRNSDLDKHIQKLESENKCCIQTLKRLV